MGDSETGRVLRLMFELPPLALLAGATACFVLRRLGFRVWAPNGAALLMLATSLALGPGVLVNVGLKDHAHRPRPIQVTEFGGPFVFRPFYRFDGACHRNCSFVSGEGSSAAWVLAPALLAPPPWRVVSITAALVFGAAPSLLRMAFGGHVTADSLFAALFSWIVILGCWRAATRLAKEPPGSAGPTPPFRASDSGTPGAPAPPSHR